ncbi:MAG: hypothetical protein HXY40_13985 [Chloroflexi bacterium]|nr:hypothetical protein [Chloroflexota bacterium]
MSRRKLLLIVAAAVIVLLLAAAVVSAQQTTPGTCPNGGTCPYGGQGSPTGLCLQQQHRYGLGMGTGYGARTQNGQRHGYRGANCPLQPAATTSGG